MRPTRAQILRAFRLPFSHGGRNFLLWQLVDRGSSFCHAAARLSRATLARRKRVVMVVGTYGKTTTTRAVAAVLGLPPDPWLDTNANCLGLVAWAVLRQAPWRRFLAVEAGISGPGRMAGYAKTLRPQVVVVTCVGDEHLQSFPNREALRAEKAGAVRALPANGVAVLNADDPNVAWMAGQTRARVVRYGFDPRWEVHVKTWTPEWPAGTRMTVSVFGEEIALQTPLLGRNTVYALLGAIAAGVVEGIPPAVAAARASRLTPTPGRLNPVPLPGGALALSDDYKSSVETVHAAFDVLERIPATRRIVVLGGLDAPPNPQRRYYRAVAAHVARVADQVIVVGPTFREYAPELKRRIAGGDRLTRLDHAPGVADVLALLGGRLGGGEVVLIKGQAAQRLNRVVQALIGREVRCAVDRCQLHFHGCGDCPLLSRPGAVGGVRKDDRIIPPAAHLQSDRSTDAES